MEEEEEKERLEKIKVFKPFTSARTEEKGALLVAALIGSNISTRLGSVILAQSSTQYVEEEIDEFVISTDDTDFYFMMDDVNTMISER